MVGLDFRRERFSRQSRALGLPFWICADLGEAPRKAQETEMNIRAHDVCTISPRFRKSIEDRIARLEMDAAQDGLVMAEFNDKDQIIRHQDLIDSQCAEALRMRLFLDQMSILFQMP